MKNYFNLATSNIFTQFYRRLNNFLKVNFCKIFNGIEKNQISVIFI